MISQTMNLLRSKLDRPLVAQPFSSLSAHKSIKHHEKLGKVLGIDNPFFRSTDGREGPQDDDRRQAGVSTSPGATIWASAGHPELIKAAKAAIDELRHLHLGEPHGVGRYPAPSRARARDRRRPSASTPRSCFVSGHAANVSTIGTLMTKDDLIVHDEFVHNSAVVGMRLSGATTKHLPPQQARCARGRAARGARLSTATRSSSSRASTRPKATFPIWHASSSSRSATALADGRRCARLRRARPYRRRPRRALRHPGRQGRHLDGHAQQGLRVLRRLHRRQHRADRYAALRRTGLRVLGRPAARR